MTKVLFGVCLLLAPPIWAAATAFTPLDIKPGQWEMTRTSKTSGAPPIPPDVLSKMTPEQKAQMDAAVKARAARGAVTTTEKRCFTKEDLSKPFMVDSAKACKTTVLSSSRTAEEVRMDCDMHAMKATVKFHVEAENSESIKATSLADSTDGTRTMNIQGTLIGKWTGPVCTAAHHTPQQHPPQ